MNILKRLKKKIKNLQIKYWKWIDYDLEQQSKDWHKIYDKWYREDTLYVESVLQMKEDGLIIDHTTIGGIHYVIITDIVNGIIVSGEDRSYMKLKKILLEKIQESINERANK